MSDTLFRGNFLQRFWDDTNLWPLEPRGTVFLGRAFLEVGRALLGESWSDDIPGVAAREWPRLERLASAERQLKEIQFEVWRRRQNALREWNRWSPDPDEFQRRLDSLEDEVNTNLGEISTAASEDQTEASKVKRELSERVQRIIVQAFLDGDLEPRYQPREAGPMTKLSGAADWNAPFETLKSRFVTCKMNLRRPGDFATDGPQHGFIFVTRPSLVTFLAKLRHALPPTSLRSEAQFVSQIVPDSNQPDERQREVLERQPAAARKRGPQPKTKCHQDRLRALAQANDVNPEGISAQAAELDEWHRKDPAHKNHPQPDIDTVRKSIARIYNEFPESAKKVRVRRR